MYLSRLTTLSSDLGLRFILVKYVERLQHPHINIAESAGKDLIGIKTMKDEEALKPRDYQQSVKDYSYVAASEQTTL
jgi:hypothetical protein